MNSTTKTEGAADARPDNHVDETVALCRELRRCALASLIVALDDAEDVSTGLRYIAGLADMKAAETIAKRNRMAPRRFIDRAALGALGHAQSELADKMRDLAKRIEAETSTRVLFLGVLAGRAAWTT